jgi:hypothetical protein
MTTFRDIRPPRRTPRARLARVECVTCYAIFTPERVGQRACSQRCARQDTTAQRALERVRLTAKRRA